MEIGTQKSLITIKAVTLVKNYFLNIANNSDRIE